MGCLTLTSLACDAKVSERVCCICAIPNFFSELRAGRASKEHPLSCLRVFLETMKEEIKYDMAYSFQSSSGVQSDGHESRVHEIGRPLFAQFTDMQASFVA
jgi:hypothetical protein